MTDDAKRAEQLAKLQAALDDPEVMKKVGEAMALDICNQMEFNRFAAAHGLEPRKLYPMSRAVPKSTEIAKQVPGAYECVWIDEPKEDDNGQ